MKKENIDGYEISIGKDLPPELNGGIRANSVEAYLIDKLERVGSSSYSEWAVIENISFTQILKIRSILNSHNTLGRYKGQLSWKWRTRSEKIPTHNKDRPFRFNLWIRKLFDE